MSPRYAANDGINSGVFRVNSSGNLGDSGVSGTYGVRPSIVLKKDIIAAGGDGTSTNPYIIK